MKILFIAPYPENESPSQRYRFEHYLPLLRKMGIEYSYHPFLDMNTYRIFFSPGRFLRKVAGVCSGFIRRWVLMFSIRKYDFVFIHREAAPLGPPVFEWIISKLCGKKVIYDFDDAIWISSSSEYNKIAGYVKWAGKVKHICKWAYKIAAGNDYLAAYAGKFNRNVFVVPTVVNTKEVHNGIQDQITDNPVIGWTGTFSTLMYLDMIVPVLQKLQKKHRFSFVLIGDKNPNLPLENYEFIRWSKSREAEDLLRIHIGLMPLFDDDFSKGKCGFKAIQYMSLGIPAVVSPVGVNTKIVENGVDGFTATSDSDWEQSIEILITNMSKRKEMGTAARKKIQLHYSVAATDDLFISLFS